MSIERIRDVMIMRYTNLLFTYLLIVIYCGKNLVI